MKSHETSFQSPLPLIVIVSLSLIIAFVFYSRADMQVKERYANIANELRQKTQTLIDEKKEAVLLIALSMGENPHIKNAIISNQPDSLELKQLSEKFKEHTPLKSLWFHIVKKNGDSFYRSWSNKRGDNILNVRLDINLMLQNPGIITAISTGIFDLTFKAMVPVYNQSEFIGIFEVIAKFNSIASKLEKDGIEPVFLVDKRYKNQIKKPYTGKFVDDYYVANINARQSHLDRIQNKTPVKYIYAKNNFLIDRENNQLAIYFELPDIKNEPMGHFILFQPLDAIAINDIYQTRNEQFLYIILLAILLFVVWRYISSMHITRKISEINQRLEEKISAKNRELIHQGQFLQGVIDGFTDTVLVIDKNYNVSMMNKAAKVMAEKSGTDITRSKCYNVAHHLELPCNSAKYKCPHAEVFSKGKTTRVIHDNITPEGKPQFVEITATPLFNEEGDVEAIIELGHDVTTHMLIHEQLTQQRERLDHQAHHDALTGLPNRILLIDRLNQALKQARRENFSVAVLFVDLDRFKEINDSLGHSIGDEVLIEIAQRLKSAIRSVDTVARLGGDEFTIILPHIDRTSSVIEVGQKLIDILSNKIIYAEHELYVSASVGISMFPGDGDSAEILLRNADSAMYQAKDVGRNNYQFYTREMTEQAFERILLEKNLRRAIEEDEFLIYYQPQYNSRTNEIIGMEALLRWQHPELGLVSPAKFIPIAEETGLIVAIGWKAMDMIIEQLLAWENSGIFQGKISINLSVKQIQDPKFIERIIEGMSQHHYNALQIQFEVTESYIMTNPEQAITTLQQLRDLKFTIAVDDFGTGYSSLSYLKRLPIDELKIDQSFVRDVPGDDEDEAIVRAVISLAKSMGLKVIAEGVETTEQQNFLLSEGCELIQGYLKQRPVEGDKITDILQQASGSRVQAG